MKGSRKFNIIFILPILLITYCGQGMGALLEKDKKPGIAIVNNIDISSPVYNFSSGSYSHDLDISIKSYTPGTQIFYTLDNSEPNLHSNIYNGIIKIHGNGKNIKIRSIAYLDEKFSNESYAEYNINYKKTSTPQILINGLPDDQNSEGFYSSDIVITITDTTPDTKIYFTTDGSDPTIDSEEFTSDIILTSANGTTTIKAMAVSNDLGTSEIVSSTFTVEYETVEPPIFTPPTGTFTSQINIKISSDTNGAQIIFTIDGSDPRISSTAKHGKALQIKESTVVKAYALNNGMWDSEVITAEYKINE